MGKGFRMNKKAKHKAKESKQNRDRDTDDRVTPRDDDRDRTVPDDQKHEEEKTSGAIHGTLAGRNG
jgi:hypothetical protein